MKFKTSNFVFKYKPFCLFKFSFLKLREPISFQTEDFEKKQSMNLIANSQHCRRLRALHLRKI